VFRRRTWGGAGTLVPIASTVEGLGITAYAGRLEKQMEPVAVFGFLRDIVGDICLCASHKVKGSTTFRREE
jgi:hypothetical protein